MADLKDVIDKLENEGTLVRNRGTHSIKSIKEIMQKSQESPAERKQTLEDSRNFQNSLLSKLAGSVGGNATPPGPKSPPPKGGIMGAIAAGLGGAGAGILGAGLGVLAGGITALGASLPMALAAAAAIVAVGGAIGGATWIVGKGAEALGIGLNVVGEGIDGLDDVGKKVKKENLINAAEGLSEFLTRIADFDNLYGAAVVWLTGNLPRVAEGITILNGISVDKERLQAAGEGLNAFMSSMGEGSFFGKLMGSISTLIVPDLTNLAGGVTKLSDASKTIELQKFLDMGTGLAHLQEPLYEFSKSGIAANFVGSNAIIDIAKGITALNETEVNRLGIVSAGLLTIDKNMFEVIKTAFIANFVGSNAITDISDGVTYLNKTEVDNMENVAAALTTIKDPLKSMTLIGLVGNFVGKGAIIDIANGAAHLVKELGTEDILRRTQLAVSSMDMIRPSLENFTTGTLWNSLKGVGAALFDFISGNESPIQEIKNLAKEADNIEKGANAIGKIAYNLDKIGSLKFDGSNINIKDFSKDLLDSVPAIEAAIMGGKIKGGIFSSDIKYKGLASADIKWSDAAKNIKTIQAALKVDPVEVVDSTAENIAGATNSMFGTLKRSIDALTAQIAKIPVGGNNIFNQQNNSNGGSPVGITLAPVRDNRYNGMNGSAAG